MVLLSRCAVVFCVSLVLLGFLLFSRNWSGCCSVVLTPIFFGMRLPGPLKKIRSLRVRIANVKDDPGPLWIRWCGGCWSACGFAFVVVFQEQVSKKSVDSEERCLCFSFVRVKIVHPLNV